MVLLFLGASLLHLFENLLGRANASSGSTIWNQRPNRRARRRRCVVIVVVVGTRCSRLSGLCGLGSGSQTSAGRDDQSFWCMVRGATKHQVVGVAPIQQLSEDTVGRPGAKVSKDALIAGDALNLDACLSANLAQDLLEAGVRCAHVEDSG